MGTFPWVRVDNLASRALAMAVRRLAGTWEQRHGCRPVLCETFVDPTRHDGASYRAANWEKIGMTAGHRGKSRTKPPKEILVMALDANFRRVLKGESRPPKRIAAAKLRGLAPVDLQPALGRRDADGFPVDDVAPIVPEMDGSRIVIDARDLARIALVHAKGRVSRGERRRRLAEASPFRGRG